MDEFHQRASHHPTARTELLAKVGLDQALPGKQFTRRDPPTDGLNHMRLRVHRSALRPGPAHIEPPDRPVSRDDTANRSCRPDKAPARKHLYQPVGDPTHGLPQSSHLFAHWITNLESLFTGKQIVISSGNFSKSFVHHPLYQSQFFRALKTRQRPGKPRRKSHRKAMIAAHTGCRASLDTEPHQTERPLL
ncbi:hypothetical protein [Amycolatopsis acidicola]|uniref:hypothetical protein n=1 Tax=Amycolatopsis acidicola TaxID=2596893 RepID=UPI001FB837CA|nr:hypothetical protein [Amycolatopsis acidicola]